MSDAQPQPPIFPPGVERGPRLRPLYHGAMWDVRPGKRGEESAAMRRRITRDPLIFAMRYLSPYLRDETTGAISFSDMHLAFYDRMARWWEPGPDRSVWASHRSAGKTMLGFLVAPLWRAAHFPDDYCLMLSDTGDQVADHLAILRGVLEDGGDLLVDFPHLRKGRPWTKTDIRTVGGARFKAAGLDKSILGARDRHVRPRYVALDEPEPGAGKWTKASKAKTLATLVNDVLPAASPNAAVVVTGTPVAVGSMVHDGMRATRGKPGALEDRGEWVRAAGFAPYWYPAIVNAGTDREESAWPTRWPLSKLREYREALPREFALQMQCDPDDPAAAQWWTDDERTSVFRWDPHFDAVWHILSIDGAVTRNEKRSDKSALAMVGVGPGVGAERQICVERAIAGHWSRTEVKEQAWALTREFRRTCRTWIVDATGSGDGWEEALRPRPAGVDIVPFTTAQDSKRHRIETLFDDYTRGAVWHAGHLVGLEAQMCAWRPTLSGPGVDDLIDAVRAAKDYALYGDASRAPAHKTRRSR